MNLVYVKVKVMSKKNCSVYREHEDEKNAMLSIIVTLDAKKNISD